jgi:hypothetical protein
VAAVAVILQNSNQGSIAQSGIATSVTPKTHEQLLETSINGLNNNQMSVNSINNEHNIVHYNEAPHDNEPESPRDNHSEIPSSTSLPNSSPVVLHKEKNNDNKPLGVTNQKTSSAVGLHSSASPTASQPSSSSSTVKPSYKNELDSLLANIDLTTFNNDKPESPIPSVRPTNPSPPVNNGNKGSATAEITTSNNLTENRRPTVLTAEPKKQKPLRGFNQQLRNEGTNFSKYSKSAVELEAEPEVEPEVEPIMGPVRAKENNQFLSANNLNAKLFKGVQNDQQRRVQQKKSKNTSLTPNQEPQRKLLRIHGRIEQTIYEIEKYINDMDSSADPLQTLKRKTLDSYISSLNAFLPEIIGYKGMTSEYQNNKRVTDIITKADDIIEKVHNIIYPKFGGKRRTQKKRKQKKQKKRFGTQKK